MGADRVWVPAAGGAPRLACDQRGSGELVFFLHGIGGNRSNWARQLERVGAHCHAVAWDARGYGESDDYEGPLDFGDFAADLLRALDHFDTRRAHLVGLSMGGRIALDFYERHAERVESLTLCDTFAGFDESFTPEARDAFIRSRQAPLLAGKTPRDMAPDVAKSLVSPSAPLEVTQQLIESMAILHVESYLKAIEATTRYERVADLSRVRVPTQVIVGADDTLTPPAVSHRIAETIPDSRLAVLEDAGHLSNLEKPDRFDEVLLAFLREVGAT